MQKAQQRGSQTVPQIIATQRQNQQILPPVHWRCSLRQHKPYGLGATTELHRPDVGPFGEVLLNTFTCPDVTMCTMALKRTLVPPPLP